MKKRSLLLLFTLGTALFLGGCAESEQDKYYKKLNEEKKRAEQINKEAADSMLNMKKVPLYDNAENSPTSNPNNKKK